MAEPYLECPDHWHRATLEADPRNGLIERVESGGTPSTTREEFWDGEVPWLTPKEITRPGRGLYVTQTERNITSVGVSGSAAKIMPVGTVMLSKRAPVGAVAVNAVPMSTNQGFLNFVCGPRLRPMYFAHWLVVNRKYLDAVANGSTYPELYKSDLFEFEIAVPDIEEQDDILRVIAALEFVALLGLPLEQSLSSPDRMEVIHGQTRRLRAISSRLVPALMSGKISPHNAARAVESAAC
jgi:hypothetical protein